MKNDVKNKLKRGTVSAEKYAEYVEKLSEMIECKTVWTRDGTYSAEFEKFYALLDKHFPNIAAKAE